MAVNENDGDDDNDDDDDGMMRTSYVPLRQVVIGNILGEMQPAYESK